MEERLSRFGLNGEYKSSLSFRPGFEQERNLLIEFGVDVKYSVLVPQDGFILRWGSEPGADFVNYASTWDRIVTGLLGRRGWRFDGRVTCARRYGSGGRVINSLYGSP